MKKISVVIPNYNRNKFLLKTLQSIEKQTINLADIEVFVVDDCSLDEDPLDVIRNITFNVELIRNETNLGQMKNLNKCLTVGQSKYIHILHSDDYIAPEFYEKVLSGFLNKNVRCVFTASSYVDESDNLIGNTGLLVQNEGILTSFCDRLMVEQLVQTPSIVVARDLYKELGGFREDLKMSEDWDMWVRIAKKYNFWYIPEFLAYYRINKISTSSKNTFNGNFLCDLKILQLEFYLFHRNKNLLNYSRCKYSNFFIGNSKQIKGWNNFLNHLIYMNSVMLKIKFIYAKLFK